jgi:hypothetical protein
MWAIPITVHRLLVQFLCILVGPKKAFLGESLVKGVFPFTTAHGQPTDALVISGVERKVKVCSGGFCQR